MSEWYATLSHWLEANPEWLGLAIFLAACLECLAVAGILIPGTVLLFALGVMAGSGALSLGQTLLLGFLGGLLGDAVSYALGRRFHQNIRRLPLLRTHPEWMNGAESYFHRYGIVSLLVGRFIGPLRPMLPMVAGMCDMPFPRFAAVSVLAAAGWSVAYLLPGWAAGVTGHGPLCDARAPDPRGDALQSGAGRRPGGPLRRRAPAGRTRSPAPGCCHPTRGCSDPADSSVSEKSLAPSSRRGAPSAAPGRTRQSPPGWCRWRPGPGWRWRPCRAPRRGTCARCPGQLPGGETPAGRTTRCSRTARAVAG